MSTMTKLPSEAVAVAATIDPDTLVPGTAVTDGIDLADFESAMFVVELGTLVATATVDINLTSGSDNSTFGNTVASSAQLTAAGGDDDKQVVFNVRGEDLPDGDRFVRVEIVVGTANILASAIGLGFNPKHGPASDFDLATVDEIVTA